MFIPSEPQVHIVFGRQYESVAVSRVFNLRLETYMIVLVEPLDDIFKTTLWVETAVAQLRPHAGIKYLIFLFWSVASILQELLRTRSRLSVVFRIDFVGGVDLPRCDGMAIGERIAIVELFGLVCSTINRSAVFPMIAEYIANISHKNTANHTEALIVIQKHIEEVVQSVTVLPAANPMRLCGHDKSWFTHQFLLHGLHVNFCIININSYPAAAFPMLFERKAMLVPIDVFIVNLT